MVGYAQAAAVETLARTAPLYERIRRVVPPADWAFLADDAQGSPE